MPFQTIRQLSRPSPTGYLVNPCCKQLINSPQNAILFVQHARNTQRCSSAHSWNRRITAKTHNNIRPRTAHFSASRSHTNGKTDGHYHFVKESTLSKSRTGHLLNLNLGWKGRGVALTSRISGQNYPPATFQHHFCHRLRREHMPTTTTGG